MKIHLPVPSLTASSDPHADFLTLIPVVSRHARIVFRHRPAAEREEAVAEAVASAFESYLTLKARGEDPVRDFPSVMATFAVLHVKTGRHVGGHQSTTDVLSPQAQASHHFQVASLSRDTPPPDWQCDGLRPNRHVANSYEERLQDNRQTPVPDQVAFRLDWPAFLQTLTERDRRMALALAEDLRASEVAERFGVTRSRVTQLRQRWCQEWRAFQEDGQADPESPSVGADAA
jgi:hypothetical protein